MFVRRVSEPQPLYLLRTEMDRLFDRFFGDDEPSQTWDPFSLRRFPALNMWQDDDMVHVEAELPGLNEDQIDITVSGNELTIKGERPAIKPEEGTTLHRRERGTGVFNRVLHLPVDIDEDKVVATCRNGVLNIELPKAAVARARHIPVKTASV